MGSSLGQAWPQHKPAGVLKGTESGEGAAKLAISYTVHTEPILGEDLAWPTCT